MVDIDWLAIEQVCGTQLQLPLYSLVSIPGISAELVVQAAGCGFQYRGIARSFDEASEVYEHSDLTDPARRYLQSASIDGGVRDFGVAYQAMNALRIRNHTVDLIRPVEEAIRKYVPVDGRLDCSGYELISLGGSFFLDFLARHSSRVVQDTEYRARFGPKTDVGMSIRTCLCEDVNTYGLFATRESSLHMIEIANMLMQYEQDVVGYWKDRTPYTSVRVDRLVSGYGSVDET